MSIADPSLNPVEPFRVFISYSQKDKSFLEELHAQLSPLKASGWILPWTDQELKPGERWEPTLQKALQEAQLVLLLDSPDFASSSFVQNEELPKALAREKAGAAALIRVRVRRLHRPKNDPLEALQYLPRGDKVLGEVTEKGLRDQLWAEVVKELHELLQKWVRAQEVQQKEQEALLLVELRAQVKTLEGRLQQLQAAPHMLSEQHARIVAELKLTKQRLAEAAVREKALQEQAARVEHTLQDLEATRAALVTQLKAEQSAHATTEASRVQEANARAALVTQLKAEQSAHARTEASRVQEANAREQAQQQSQRLQQPARRFIVGLLAAVGLSFYLGWQWQEASENVAALRALTSFEWISIPGTGPDGFWMGSKDGVGAADERPRHKVVVQPFKLSKTEVTVAQYQACVDAGKCTPPNWDSCYSWIDGKWELGKVSDLFKDGQQPVVCVDWSQAKAYAAWLSTVVGGTVRLPTEAEWEYAARGKEEREYPWGNSPEPSCDVAVLDPPGEVGDGCGQGSTWPVCAKEKGNTPSGLCDMAGNVWEWVEDCYHSNYTGAPKDGTALIKDCSISDSHVIRGGSWDGVPVWLRGANRGRDQAGDWLRYVGLRVVLVPVPGGEH